MKKTGIFIKRPQILNGAVCYPLLSVLLVFGCLSQLYGADPRTPIDVNLIIDGSASQAGVKEEISAWVLSRLDQILMEGDRVTIWSAGDSARVVYTGRINNDADREAVRNSIREISASSGSADFSGALRDAAGRQSSGFSYTLLVCASPAALSSILSGPQASLLRFSRIEEFSGWRALVVGLNLEQRVRRAAANFFGS
jgi:hypothetical protein